MLLLFESHSSPPGKLSSNAGQPQPDLNLASELQTPRESSDNADAADITFSKQALDGQPSYCRKAVLVNWELLQAISADGSIENAMPNCCQPMTVATNT